MPSYTLTFTASDTYSTSSGELAYQVRTAASGGGTLLLSGTATSGVEETTTSISDSTLVDGSNTRYLRITDGAGNVLDQSFTVTADLITEIAQVDSDTLALAVGRVRSATSSRLAPDTVTSSETPVRLGLAARLAAGTIALTEAKARALGGFKLAADTLSIAPSPVAKSAVLSVATGADDGDRRSDTDLRPSSARVAIGHSGTSITLDGWYRWEMGAVSLAQAQIVSATLALLGSDNGGGSMGSPETTLYAELASAPLPPIDNPDYDAKPTTTASVDWDVAPLVDETYEADVTAIIQELADNQNPTAIQILHKNRHALVAGSDYQAWCAFESGLTPATLTINYTVPSPPVVVFGISRLVNAVLALVSSATPIAASLRHIASSLAISAAQRRMAGSKRVEANTLTVSSAYLSYLDRWRVIVDALSIAAATNYRRTMPKFITETVAFTSGLVRKGVSTRLVNEMERVIEALAHPAASLRHVAGTVALAATQLSFTGPVKMLGETLGITSETVSRVRDVARRLVVRGAAISRLVRSRSRVGGRDRGND